MSNAPYITYANAHSTKREAYGHPLWELDPAGRDPVELADVGYIFRGNFVKLFNARSEADGSRIGKELPEGFEQLNVRGDFIRLNPLPKVPEEIASKGVRKIGGNANLSAG
jgi:hypothetical protein